MLEAEENYQDCEMITRFSKYQVIVLTFIKSSFGGVVGGKRPITVDLEEERNGDSIGTF